MNIRAIQILLRGAEPDGVDCLSTSIEYGNGSSAEIETTIFLYSLVRRTKPKIILQSGTHLGYSSAWMAAGLKDNWTPYRQSDPGHLYTCDVGDYDKRPEKLWKECRVDKFVTNIVVGSHDFQPPVQYADFIFLDSDHGVEFVIEEWEHYVPYFNPHKIMVVFHDTRLDVREAEAIHQIRESHIPAGYKHVSHLALRNLRGLDILQLSNEDYQYASS